LKINLKKPGIVAMIPILLIAAGILILGGLIYNFQEKMIFFPEKLPADFNYSFDGNSNFEEIDFQTSKGIVINGLLFKAENSKGVVLYFHGNAGSLRSWGYVAEDFTQKEYDILIIDYRGYGKSTGNIKGEDGFHHDAKFIYNELLGQYQEDNIVIYGRSIGTAIAARLAAENNPKSLILESAYFNFIDLANYHYSFLPNSPLLKFQLETNVYVKETKCPVHLIHGTNDRIVPYVHSVRLSEISDNIELKSIEGGGHNDLSEFQEYHIWLHMVLSIGDL